MGNQVNSLCIFLSDHHHYTSHRDTLKGSFYANPIVENVTVSDEEKRQFPEYYGKNICMSATMDHNLPLSDIRQGP